MLTSLQTVADFGAVHGQRVRGKLRLSCDDEGEEQGSQLQDSPEGAHRLPRRMPWPVHSNPGCFKPKFSPCCTGAAVRLCGCVREFERESGVLLLAPAVPQECWSPSWAGSGISN